MYETCKVHKKGFDACPPSKQIFLIYKHLGTSLQSF